MIRFLKGPDQNTLRSRVMDLLLAEASKKRNGLILVTPEQFSFDAERELCQRGGDTICRFAEVLSFSRLASRVESLYGGCGKKWLDQGGRYFAAAQAVNHVYSRIKVFASVCQKTEFLEMLLRLIDELTSYGISPRQLSELSRKMDGRFAQKLEEIGLLYESYLAVTAQAQDPLMRLQSLSKLLEEQDYAEEKSFYICGFSDFTTLESGVVENLLLSAAQITIALPEEETNGTEIYAASAESLNRLCRFCASHDLPYESEKVPYCPEGPTDLCHLQKLLPSPGEMTYPGKKESVFVHQYKTKDEELRHCAARIAELVQNGARYRDIAVALAEPQDRMMLKSLLRQAGIDAYFAGNTPASDNHGTRILIYALRAVSNGLERDSVLDYLHSGASGLTDDQCDRLENYAICWNIHGSRWAQTWELHPFGLDEEWTDEIRAYLDDLNACRETGLVALLDLKHGLDQAKTVADMSCAAFDFLQQIHFPDLMQAMSDAMFAENDFEGAQQYGQIYDLLVNVLEQSAMMLQDCSRSVEEYCRLLEKVLLQYHVGTVPATVDQVTVGDLAAFRGHKTRHLLVIGASDGSFPRYSASVGMLTEEERIQLRSSGIELAPLRADAMERELGVIYQVIRSAEESLTISCTGENPAYLMSKIASVFRESDTAETTQVVLNEMELAAGNLCRGTGDADSEITQSLAEKSNYDFGTIRPEHCKQLYGPTLYLSASKVDKLADCRFAYFMKYGLSATVRKEASFDAAAFGNFVHSVLEHTVNAVIAEGGFHEVSEERLRELANSAMDAYRDEKLADILKNTPSFSNLFVRNREEALAIVMDLGNELRNSDFEPAACELNFSNHGKIPAVYAKGKRSACILTGYVDRVDLYRDGDDTYVRVVDYKTGSKDFDYTDISVGKGMQMLLYLFALKANGKTAFGVELQPAGVLYHMASEKVLSFVAKPTDERISDERADSHHRKGLILEDDRVCEAMEHGSTKVYIKGAGRADPSKMDALEQHTYQMLAKLSDDIFDGSVQPNPIVRGKDSSCKFCDFWSVCQKDRGLQAPRSLRNLKQEEFFAEIMKGGDDRGQD